MRILVLISSLAVASVLAACSSPPHELAQAGQSRSFLSTQEPATVYRKIVEGARICYAKREVVADYFPDNRTGKVSMSVKTSLNITSLFVAEIAPSKEGSRVTVSFLKGNPVFADAVEQWSNGSYSLCPFA